MPDVTCPKSRRWLNQRANQEMNDLFNTPRFVSWLQLKVAVLTDTKAEAAVLERKFLELRNYSNYCQWKAQDRVTPKGKTWYIPGVYD